MSRFASSAIICQYGSPARITSSSIARLGATAVFIRAIDMSSPERLSRFMASSTVQLATETCAAKTGVAILAE
jgi:hypothetical protein